MTTPLPSFDINEALKVLLVDHGVVSSPVNAGGNSITDVNKAWVTNMHVNRLLKVVSGQGSGQARRIAGNSPSSIVTDTPWTTAIEAGARYVIISADYTQILRDVFGGGSNISAANPLEVHDPKVGSLISYEGTTDADGNPAGTTLVCSGLAAEADFDGNTVIITSGDYSGQARDITGATNGGTVVPHNAFGGQIVSGTNFVIAALRLTPAEVASLMADVGDASASTLGSLYAILGNPTTALATRLGNPDAHTLADLAAKIGDIARSLDLIIGGRWDAAGDLGTDIGSILTNIAEIPLWDTPNTGTHTTAGATEETILTTAFIDSFRLWFLIDLSNMAVGDTFVLRAYQRVDGTNLRLKDEQSFSDTQTIQVYEIDGIYGDTACDIQITIQRTAGVDRPFEYRWNILKEP